jgi:hypothetical protein
MTELADWLRATINSDLQAAKDLEAASWRVTSWTHERVDGGGDERIALVDEDGRKLIVFTWPDVDVTQDELEHMAIHDPRDTIARCEAELQIVDLHGEIHEGPCVSVYDYPQPPCRELRVKAYGYRHRPGWLEEWRP